jgi:hypothetical protein
MLIRKGSGKIGSAPSGAGQQSEPGRQRLGILLEALEKNLALEEYFIARKDIASLLDLLPGQGDILESIVDLAGTLGLAGPEAADLDRRLGAAGAWRAKNRDLLDESIRTAKSEIEEMNAARRRLQQMRTLSKNIYSDPEPSKLENWA